MTAPTTCDKCDRKLVTRLMLAKAIHAGCALTGEKHDLEQCPQRPVFELDAKMLWKHMDGQSAQK